jgi:hypothetical protein
MSDELFSSTLAQLRFDAEQTQRFLRQTVYQRFRGTELTQDQANQVADMLKVQGLFNAELEALLLSRVR